jgi:hypothetical protein
MRLRRIGKDIGMFNAQLQLSAGDLLKTSRELLKISKQYSARVWGE